MKKILFIFIVLTCSLAHGQEAQDSDTTSLTTPEGIGEYLSELLINRGDIDKSAFALNFNQMFPNEDFSKYEDSPANFILSILRGSQVMVSQNWNNLLFNMDSLYQNNDFKYAATYFINMHKEKYSCVAVLKKSMKYYSLQFELLNWKKANMYVISISDTLAEFDSVENLKNNFTNNVFEVSEKDLADEVKPENTLLKKYHFNNECNIKVQNKRIPPLNLITKSIIQDIKDNKKPGDLSYKEGIEKNILEEKWNDIIKLARKEGIKSLYSNDISLSNVQIEREDGYVSALNYRLKTNKQTYLFAFFLTLEDNNWEIIDISSIEKEPELTLNLN